MLQIYAHRVPDKGRAINHVHTDRVKELTQMGNIQIILLYSLQVTNRTLSVMMTFQQLSVVHATVVTVF
jgi:hypothetical protein